MMKIYENRWLYIYGYVMFNPPKPLSTSETMRHELRQKYPQGFAAELRVYVCMSVCMSVFADVWMYGCMHALMHGCMYVRVSVCMYVCMHLWMYGCMDACVYVGIRYVGM